MKKVLIDTNVIIDALAAREPFRADAEIILTLVAKDEIAGFVTGSSVTDIYYLLRRTLSHDVSLKAIETLIEMVGVVSVGKNECVAAIRSGMDDFEDAVALVCAEKARVDCIVSRDEKFAREACPVPVLFPATFLRNRKRS